MDVLPEISDIDARTLSPVVALLLGSTDVRVVTFVAEPITYKSSNPVSVALVRFRGTAEVAGDVRPWSVVLKATADPGDVPFGRFRLDETARALLRDVGRWDREALFYESDLTDGFEGDLVAPRCFRVDRAPGRAWLWLDDVEEDMPRWDAWRYALAARHLGAFNARWLGSDRALPEWVSRDPIVSWTEAMGSTLPGFLANDAIWSDPTVRAELPGDAREELGRLWARRASLYAILRSLPHGFAHLDAFRGNLLSRRRGDRPQTVAIDWSFAGLAPVGAEVSQLVCASVFYQGEPLDPWLLDGETFAAYVEGLREGGCAVGTELVRRGCLAATVVRWSFVVLPLALAADPDLRASVEARSGTPYREHMARLGQKIRYTQERLQELGRLL